MEKDLFISTANSIVSKSIDDLLNLSESEIQTIGNVLINSLPKVSQKKSRYLKHQRKKSSLYRSQRIKTSSGIFRTIPSWVAKQQYNYKKSIEKRAFLRVILPPIITQNTPATFAIRKNSDKNSKYYNSDNEYDGKELHCLSGWSYKWE